MTHLTLCRIYFIVSILLLSGCSTIAPNQNSITFDSNPPGATFSSGNEVWGVGPVTRIWTLNGSQARSVSAPITARWVSGATTNFTMNLQAGQEGSYTIDRPQGVAGIEADIQWAIHLRQQQQVQAARASEAAYNLGRALGGGGSSSGSSNSNSGSTCGYKSDGNYHCGTNCGYKSDGNYHCE